MIKKSYARHKKTKKIIDNLKAVLYTDKKVTMKTKTVSYEFAFYFYGYYFSKSSF